MIKLKNLINEQNNEAPIKADNGQIIVGNNRYQLKADTSLPFGYGDGPIDVLALKRNSDGSLNFVYDKDGEPTSSIIDDKVFIQNLEAKLANGEREVDLTIMKDKMPSMIQKVLNSLKLVKV
mgnify:CR=1 FL=1